MATRRMIQSTIWEDEFVGNLSFFERLLWIGLFSRCADDQGRLLDNPVVIRAQVFPYDDLPISDVQAALALFESKGKIIRYSVGGRDLVQLMRWWNNQKPQWANESKYPGPPNWIDTVRIKDASGKVRHWQSEYREGDHEATLEDIHVDTQQGSQVVRHVYVHVYVYVHVQREIAPALKWQDWPELEELSGPPLEQEATPPGHTPPPVSGKQPKRPREAKPLPPPAVQVFHGITGKYPAKGLFADIDAAVGKETVFWSRVVKGWLAMGWNPGNVGGMLDFFERREVPGSQPGNGTGKSPPKIDTSHIEPVDAPVGDRSPWSVTP